MIQQRKKRISAIMSRDVKRFWSKIEKLAIHRHQEKISEKWKLYSEQKLRFFIEQTERYSVLLVNNLQVIKEKRKRKAEIGKTFFFFFVNHGLILIYFIVKQGKSRKTRQWRSKSRNYNTMPPRIRGRI